MPNIADYIYYTMVYDYLNDKIGRLGLDLMGRMMVWADTMAMTLVTLWIMIQGFRNVTGQSRESITHLITSIARVMLVVSAATTMAVMGPSAQMAYHRPGSRGQ